MNIQLVKDSSMKSHAAHLVLTVDDLPKEKFSGEEITYLSGQKEDKKSIVSINRLTHRDYVVFITDKDDNAALEDCRKAGDDLWCQIKNEKQRNLAIYDHVKRQDKMLACVEGYALGSYAFGNYKVKEKEDVKIAGDVDLISDAVSEKELMLLKAVIKATFRARDLVNEPVMTLNAEALAEAFKEMASESGMDVEVFDRKQIESLRMGGLLGVNMGSVDDPTFTKLEWKPANAVNKKPVILVGKGVVYDTGGMNIKTGVYMDDMKSDMGGAAAVGGAIYAAAMAKLPVHIIMLVPATDNRVNGNAIVSGDILTMYNGATVEVLNTDAEGRLILADALAYAKQFDPEVVIDAATLTGAAQRAVGKYATVGMQAKAEEAFKNLQEAGSQVCERIVEFPLWDDYKELMKSEIADIRNISTGAEGGAITAGKFLEYFTDYPYIHLDIAGTALVNSRYGYRGVGGTGVGVRMLFRYFRNMI